MITPGRAFEIAAHWTNFLSLGEQGMPFNSFFVGDASPIDHDHRQLCIAYTIRLLTLVVDRPESDDQQVDRSNLIGLLYFFDNYQPQPIIPDFQTPSPWAIKT